MNEFTRLVFKAQEELDKERDTGNARHLRNMISFYDQAFEQDCKGDPNFWIALVNRSYGYYYLGELEKALQDMETVRELKPKEYSVFSNLAAIYDELGNFSKAHRDSIRAIELEQDDPEVYCNYAAVLCSEGLFEASIGICEETIAKDPYHFGGYANRGVALFYLKRFDEAIQDAKKAIELAQGRREGKREAGLVVNLADAYQAAGRKFDAEINYRYVLKLVSRKEEQDLTVRDYFAAAAAERGLHSMGINPETDFERRGIETGMLRKEILDRKIPQHLKAKNT
ncbi:tetratricopeptide repeat protein [Candidatus Woesearchaeota archaeon]|nr:tetratricopeptide repeat protein [Candidatus Woesearchaeota archaeon]